MARVTERCQFAHLTAPGELQYKSSEKCSGAVHLNDEMEKSEYEKISKDKLQDTTSFLNSH